VTRRGGATREVRRPAAAYTPPARTPSAPAEAVAVRRRRRLLPTRDELPAVAAGAILFALAFPPLPFVVPAALCLVPLALALAAQAARGAGWGAAARTGFWFAVVANVLAAPWVAPSLALSSWAATLAYPVLLAELGIAAGLAALAVAAGRRATRLPFAVLLPVAWVGQEVLLASAGDLAVPWLPLGLAVAHVPTLVQLADVSGVLGLSAWLAATGGLLADAWLARTPRARAAWLGVAALLAVAVAGYGQLRLRTVPLRPLARVLAVQPNVAKDEKDDAAAHDRIVGVLGALTRDSARAGDAALVVWPETALPDILEARPAWRDSLRAVAASVGRPILFGTVDVEVFGPGDAALYNALLLAGPDGELSEGARYRKRFLVPVVERVPLVDPAWVGLPRALAGYGRGGDATPFALPFGGVGALICYESIFASRAREQRRAGASLLVIASNDAWLGDGIGPYQHEAHARLRAVENRAGVLRVANTGITEFVDPLGRAVGATALGTRAAVTYATTASDARSPYVLLGDWLGALCAVGAVGLLMLGVRARRRSPRAV
jgi:apolipoprotein N-acyltransferase